MNSLKRNLIKAYINASKFIGEINNEETVAEINQVVRESIESYNRHNEIDIEVKIDEKTGQANISLTPLSMEAFNDICEYDPSIGKYYEWNDILKKPMRKQEVEIVINE